MNARSKVLLDKVAMYEHALGTARKIAAQSPIAVVGTKAFMNYSRDHTTADGLEYAANWNMAMLQTEDIPVAVSAGMSKTTPKFSKL